MARNAVQVALNVYKMNPYRATLSRWANRPSFVPFAKWVVRPLDLLLRRTGVPFSAVGTGLPTVYLTTKGRMSGRWRTVPVLGIKVPAGTGLIASNNGQDFRPGWYYNLMAESRCRLQRGRHVSECVARVTTPEERDELWRQALEAWPPYQAFAHRVNRDLDMFILERISPG